MAKLGTVKDWSLDQGHPDILAMHNEAHQKWTVANNLLAAYRSDRETQGRAELEGDTEAGARSRQAAEN
eukprot:10507299-Prorocentrum_lima.AAC.1